MAISQELKATLIKKFGGDSKNTGKVEVQIAILTAEIESLTKHIVSNKKDQISKRGLFQKVSKRRSLLSYLKNVDIVRYRQILKDLEIRGN
ncbi:MAG: 30S ribosomal protein S15 [Malacoplasma sp.]|nr:30S ribosomal protein S15 [Malacoplasma sp.]